MKKLIMFAAVAAVLGLSVPAAHADWDDYRGTSYGYGAYPYSGFGYGGGYGYGGYGGYGYRSSGRGLLGGILGGLLNVGSGGYGDYGSGNGYRINSYSSVYPSYYGGYSWY